MNPELAESSLPLADERRQPVFHAAFWAHLGSTVLAGQSRAVSTIRLVTEQSFWDVGGLFNRRNIYPLSAWQVVEPTLCLWMELKVKSCNLFAFCHHERYCYINYDGYV